MIQELPNFQKLQYEFTAHIRDPDNVPCPSDIEDRRMAVYRDLFFNNIEGFISSGFPVARKLYTEEKWKLLVRKFFNTHRSHSPYFLKITEEFLEYLKNEHEATADDPPYLVELMHYEWVELALSVAEENTLENIDPEGDLLDNIPVISPDAWVLAYTYPVHTISPENTPTAPSDTPTFLVVYRKNDNINFIEINGMTANLLQIFNKEDNTVTGKQALDAVATQLPHIPKEKIYTFGSQTLEDLRSKGIIAGIRLP